MLGDHARGKLDLLICRPTRPLASQNNHKKSYADDYKTKGDSGQPSAKIPK